MNLLSRRNSIKCYLSDTGLATRLMYGDSETASAEIHRRILSGNIELNEGMLMENVVAQMLKASGHQLYFYTNSRERIEIDFLVHKPVLSSRRNICPIEVKSGSNLTHASLDKLREKYAKFLAEAFLLYDRDLKQKDGITYLPLYMAPFIVAGG